MRTIFEGTADYWYLRELRGVGEAFLTSKTRPGRVSVRPLTALTRALCPALPRREGEPAAVRKLALVGDFLHSVARTGDTRLVPLAAPTTLL